MKLMNIWCMLCLAVGWNIESLAAVNFQSALSQPLKMDRGSVHEFFTKIFPTRGFSNYACGPLLDFLSYNSYTQDPTVFTLRIVDMFHARMKEAVWLNPYDVLALLEGIRVHVGPLLHKGDGERLSAVKKGLYRTLLTRFRELKEDPDMVMQDMAIELLHVADTAGVVRLRTMIIRLIESVLDRVIWLPAEQEMAWQVTKQIADSLHQLYQEKIIPDGPTLNHCLWSLTYRFAYCIEIGGTQFSLATYHQIKQDIVQQASALFSFEDERQGLMLSRANWLKAAVIAGETRVRHMLDTSW